MATSYLYLIFIISIILTVGIDIFFSKKILSIKSAVLQFGFWVIISLCYCALLLKVRSSGTALKYISGYIMELSLSIDNVFVFILIFKHYKIEKQYINKLLLIGVLLAIVLRVFFIATCLGIILKFAWILYAFGPFLIYTGLKIFLQKEGDEVKEIKESNFIRFLKRKFNFTAEPHHGKYIKKHKNKIYFTTLSLVVLFLGFTDFIFTLDSIPTVISLVKTPRSLTFTSDEILVIYSSNVFAILGLRALFIILMNMVNKFSLLPKAIAIILVFIGIKMFIEIWHIEISTFYSLLIIIMILLTGIGLSLHTSKRLKRKNIKLN